MGDSKKFPSIPATQLAIRFRRHSLIVQEPAKPPGWSVAYSSQRPADVAVFPVLVKDMEISGKLAEILRRRLGIAADRFWPEW